jgi:hypothetical protein
MQDLANEGESDFFPIVIGAVAIAPEVVAGISGTIVILLATHHYMNTPHPPVDFNLRFTYVNNTDALLVSVGVAVLQQTTAQNIKKQVILNANKEQKSQPLSDCPDTQEGIDKERKEIKVASKGKPSPEQKARLEKLKKQEKYIGNRQNTLSGNKKKSKQ